MKTFFVVAKALYYFSVIIYSVLYSNVAMMARFTPPLPSLSFMDVMVERERDWWLGRDRYCTYVVTCV